MRVTRRSILRGIGLGTATLFGNPILRHAFAQRTPAKRLLVLCMPNCSIKASWVPTGGRDAIAKTGDATQFQWNMCNQPLESIRQYVTLIDGLDHKKVGGDPHGSGFIRYSTGGTIRAGENTRDPGAGRLPGDGNMSVLPSIDQLMIQKSPIIGDKSLAIPGGLQLAIDTRGRTDGIHFIILSWSVDSPTKALPPENTPYKTYSRVVALAGPGSSTPEQQMAIEKALTRKKSALDYLKADLGRLQGRLGSQQKVKLEDHLNALREYENTLVFKPGTLPGPTIKPAPSIEMVAPNTNANYQKIWEQYHDMAKLVFQLDLTRTITILYGHGNQAWNGLHSTAHGGSADKLAQHTRIYMEMMAAFVKRCAAVTDFDGQPLIDNMVMTYSSDVSERHNFINVPYLLFGGKNLGVKGGRVLRYPGYASNDVMSSLLKPFGVNMPVFGDPAHAKGPLPELVT